MRIALGLEYEGTPYAGWQSQPHGNTVQDHLDAALSAVADAPVVTSVAGRTDAGVHALVQVVHFDAPTTRPLTAWVRGVNAQLPPTIAVRWAQPVADTFHARFAAHARHYRYVLLNRSVRPGVGAGRVGWFHLPLDVHAMAQGAAHLVGEHDFSSFRAADCQAKTPVKTLHHLRVERHGEWVVFDVCANAFLHHMVRNIVGALVYVGKGACPPAWMATLRDARARTLAPPTFGPEGLYLVGVEYEEGWQLPQKGRIIAPFAPFP